MRPAPFIALLLFAAACSDEKERVQFAKEHQAEIEAALVPFGRVPALLEQTPRFTELSRLAAPEVPPYFESVGKGDFEKVNALVLHAEDLVELGTPGKVPFRIEGASTGGWTLPDEMVVFAKTGQLEGMLNNIRVAKSAFGRLQRARYALVVRTARFEQVKETGENQLTPAELEGDAVLVDLKAGKVLGGFPLHVRGRDTLYRETRKGPIKGMTMTESLEHASDLQLKNLLGVGLAAGLEELAPGAVPPYATSYYREEWRKRG